MSKDSIKLSPKYGLNATICKCFWCREEIGIALLGKIKVGDDKDFKAPSPVVTSYEPCEACKEIFSKGIHVIGVTEHQPKDERPPLQENPDLYPTGAFLYLLKILLKIILREKCLKKSLKKKTFDG